MLTPSHNDGLKREASPGFPHHYPPRNAVTLPMANPDWIPAMPPRRRVPVAPPVPVAMEEKVPVPRKTGSPGGLFSFFSRSNGESKNTAASMEAISSATVAAPRPVGDSPLKQRVSTHAFSGASRQVYHQPPVVQFSPLAAPMWNRKYNPHANKMLARPIESVSQMHGHGREGPSSSMNTSQHALLSVSVNPPTPVGPKRWMQWPHPAPAAVATGATSPCSPPTSSNAVTLTSQVGSTSSVTSLAANDKKSNHLHAMTLEPTLTSSSSVHPASARVFPPSTGTNSSSTRFSTSLGNTGSFSTAAMSSAESSFPSSSLPNKFTTTKNGPLHASPATTPKDAFPTEDFLHPSTHYDEPASEFQHHTRQEAVPTARDDLCKESQAKGTNSIAVEAFSSSALLPLTSNDSTEVDAATEQDIWGTNETFHGSVPLFFSSSNDTINTGNVNEVNNSLVGNGKHSGSFSQITGVHFYDPLNEGELTQDSPKLAPRSSAGMAFSSMSVDPTADLKPYSTHPSPFSTSYLDAGSSTNSHEHGYGVVTEEDSGMDAFKPSSGVGVEEEDGMEILRKLFQSVGVTYGGEESSSGINGGMMTPRELFASLSVRGSSSPPISFSAPLPFSTSSRAAPQRSNGLFPSL